MFRKVAPWYSKRFGPVHEFNKRVVKLVSRDEFLEMLAGYRQWRAQFLDELGELKPQYQPVPLPVAFPSGAEPAATTRSAIPVPGGPVEVW
jgi:hypothetical protein